MLRFVAISGFAETQSSVAISDIGTGPGPKGRVWTTTQWLCGGRFCAAQSARERVVWQSVVGPKEGRWSHFRHEMPQETACIPTASSGAHQDGKASVGIPGSPVFGVIALCISNGAEIVFGARLLQYVHLLIVLFCHLLTGCLPANGPTAGGELFFHLSKAGRFTEDRTRFYIAEIVLAIDYLHGKDIIYRDLKPENILLDSEGHVKITDFGLCKENVPDNVSAHSFCGTPEYLAPEILRKVGHGKAADWWTLGALIYEMLCGVPPFYSRSRDALFDKILRQKIRFPNYFSRESIDIIKQLMQRNPKYRLGSRNGAKEVQVHIFFSSMDWDALYRREVEPPFRPRLSKDKHGVEGGANFDPEFTGMPIHSPETSKRKYAPFEEFTFNKDTMAQLAAEEEAHYVEQQ